MNRTREERRLLYTDAAQIIRERGLLQNGFYALYTGERCTLGALAEAAGVEFRPVEVPAYRDGTVDRMLEPVQMHLIFGDGVMMAEITRKLFGVSRYGSAVTVWNDNLDPGIATETAARLLETLAKDLS